MVSRAEGFWVKSSLDCSNPTSILLSLEPPRLLAFPERAAPFRLRRLNSRCPSPYARRVFSQSFELDLPSLPATRLLRTGGKVQILIAKPTSASRGEIQRFPV